MLTEFLYTYRQRLTQPLSTELSVNIVRILTEKIDTISNRTSDSETTWILSFFRKLEICLVGSFLWANCGRIISELNDLIRVDIVIGRNFHELHGEQLQRRTAPAQERIQPPTAPSSRDLLEPRKLPPAEAARLSPPRSFQHHGNDEVTGETLASTEKAKSRHL